MLTTGAEYDAPACAGRSTNPLGAAEAPKALTNTERKQRFRIAEENII
jgi:hypothetical protein